MAVHYCVFTLVLGLTSRHTDERTKMLRRQQRRILSLRRILSRIHGRNNPSPPPVHISDRDILQFGVYTGGGLRAWVDAMPLLSFNFTGTLWGFDSFVGMPREDEALLLRHHKRDKAWLPGGLNASALLGTADWRTVQQTIIGNVGYADTKLVRGFFDHSLAGGKARARELGIRPAFLIDIDCDLTSSTRTALTFALEAGLLRPRAPGRPGTFVYYDDLSEHDRMQAELALKIEAQIKKTGRSSYTAKQLSELKEVATMNEENVAHELVTAEWGLTWRALPPVGVYPGPLGLNRHPNPVAWIEQMPKSFTGRWLPPQRYCALRELLSCARCEHVDA